MTTEPTQNKYQLSFQALDGGGANVNGWYEPSKAPMPIPLSFIEGGEISFVLQPPTGSKIQFSSIELSFTVKDGNANCKPSPFGNGMQPDYRWCPGDEYAVPQHLGAWCFSAKLTALDGTIYTLPDPEFHVGAGGGNGDGDGHGRTQA